MIQKIVIKIPQLDLTIGSEFKSPHPMQDEESVKNLLKQRAAHILVDKLEELGGYITYD